MRLVDRNIMIFSALLLTLGTVMQVWTLNTPIGFNSSLLAFVLSSAAVAALIPLLQIDKVKAHMNEERKSNWLFFWITAFWAGSLPVGMLLAALTGGYESGWLVFIGLCAWAPAVAFSFLLINCLPKPNRGI